MMNWTHTYRGAFYCRCAWDGHTLTTDRGEYVWTDGAWVGTGTVSATQLAAIRAHIERVEAMIAGGP